MNICRHCEEELINELIDLGHAPPSNNYLSKDLLLSAETYFPLKLLICHSCWLVQTVDYNDADNLFKVYEPLEQTTYYWAGDDFVNRKRTNINEGWVKV